MKKIAVILLALTLSGCAFKEKGNRIAAAAVVARSVAEYGARTISPKYRPAIEAAIEALDRLIQDGNYDPQAFRVALGNLPSLKSRDGEIWLTAVVTIFEASTAAEWSIETKPAVKAVMLAIREGLQAGLLAGRRSL